jgi:hypothetical protein
MFPHCKFLCMEGLSLIIYRESLTRWMNFLRPLKLAVLQVCALRVFQIFCLAYFIDIQQFKNLFCSGVILNLPFWKFSLKHSWYFPLRPVDLLQNPSPTLDRRKISYSVNVTLRFLWMILGSSGPPPGVFRVKIARHRTSKEANN